MSTHTPSATGCCASNTAAATTGASPATASAATGTAVAAVAATCADAPLLCFDIGNTSTHWALFVGEALLERGDIPTATLEQDALALLDAHPQAHLGACSVVPAATKKLQALADANARALYLLTAADAPTLTITYPRPAEIGPDRLANAIGAQALVGAPAIVIDMGTATTFDIISRSEGYIGGIIAPGLAAMTHYLHEKTALLPKLDAATLSTGPRIGQSTVEAMSVGATRGYPGMIAALLAASAEELAARGEPAPAVILTGGASRGFVREAFAQYPADPDITLKGLAVALRHKHSQA